MTQRHPPDHAVNALTTGELVDALQHAVGLVRSHFAAATAAAGVTPVQAKVLRQLTRPTTVKDLATQLGADISNTSSTIDRLETLGLVEKQTGSIDRRVRLITLTDHGRRVRTTLDDVAFNSVPALENLSTSERYDLYRLLRKVGGETHPA
ncbi:MarR family winged helix-turn-helix transcriptional regulator [Nocardia sp. alder85J]|uniref:MarR family winged helix-turn-helix transcriptional regulator n=1 Tax=Nocardia sp. alder85J TaxID=2862949 RepID=UPI001CD5A22A|nr:MarR family transcriptional regulator [Nocardia sp. alder85J]MCX4094441.1 MarR family transcriptional regulator [Nocardia sp. alder85J]